MLGVFPAVEICVNIVHHQLGELPVCIFFKLEETTKSSNFAIYFYNSSLLYTKI